MVIYRFPLIQALSDMTIGTLSRPKHHSDVVSTSSGLKLLEK